MEPSNSLSDVVERIYSWIPRKIESQRVSSTVSREFWMPDRSCRVCFECESQFSLFNRRHHCRLCGRVFCKKCSLNTVSANLEEGCSYEEGERVRVCNFCYDLRVTKQSSIPPIEPTPTLTPSSSAQSIPTSVSLSSEQAVCGGLRIPRPASAWDDEADEEYLDQLTLSNYQRVSGVSCCSSPCAMDPPSSNDFDRGDEEEDVCEMQQEENVKLSESHREYDYGDESGTDMVADHVDIEGKSESSIPSSQTFMGQIPGSSDDGSESIRRSDTDDRKDIDGIGKQLDDKRGMPVGKPPSHFVDYQSNPAIWDPPGPADDHNDAEDEGGNNVDEEEDDEGRGWRDHPSPSSIGSSAGSMDSRNDKAALDEHRRDILSRQFKNLVAQLLQQKGIDVGELGDPDSWLEIVSSVSWQAAEYIKPDTSNGGEMDPSAYVKVKCVACGRPRDSALVKGIVFKKNVAHKRMTSKCKKPRLLLLGGALEYQRVSNQLSSLDTLLQQERDHLGMTVSRIEVHKPNVLLVEKTVSRFAQDILLNKDITLVLNVKRPLLERIARCVGGQVVPSPDALVTPSVVHCEDFHVEKFVEEHGSAGLEGKQLTKFLMFFEGFQKPLGCTVLLKGANGDYLKAVKKVVQLAVFSAYHLNLETSFLKDEGATLPATCRSTINMHSNSGRSTSSSGQGSSLTISRPAQSAKGSNSSNTVTSPIKHSMSNSMGSSTAFTSADMVPSASTVANAFPISASTSCASSTANSPGTSPAQLSFECQSNVWRTSSMGGTMTTTYHRRSNGVYRDGQSWQGFSGLSISLKRNPFDANHGAEGNAELATSNGGDECLSFEVKALEENTVTGSLSLAASDQVVTTKSTSNLMSKGIIRERGEDYHIYPDEVQANLHVLVENNWKSDMEPDREDILVQLSRRCLSQGTFVKGPQFLRIKYYGNADKPLGMFLRDTLFDMSRPCERCYESGDAHIYCYTHRQGSLTITVKKIDKPLSGEKDGRIWMWHRCLECPLVDGVPPSTPRVVMSKEAWGLSFGKFLELSFSTHPAASRLAACGHSLHRDCLRFYGFGSMVACFRYADITIHSVYLPPLRPEFKSERQEWLQKEIEEVEYQRDLVFSEFFKRLRELGAEIANFPSTYGNSVKVDTKRRILALEVLLQREKKDFEEAEAKAVSKTGESGKPLADILELNFLRRELLYRSAQWERGLKILKDNFYSNMKSGTGSVDDASISSILAKNSGNENGSRKFPDSAEAEYESPSVDTNFGDGESMSEPESVETANVSTNSRVRATGSIQPEQVAPDEPSRVLPQSAEVEDAALKVVCNERETSVVADSTNGNDLGHLQRTLSPSPGELLEKLEPAPRRGHISGSKSISVTSNEVIRGSPSIFGGNQEEVATESPSKWKTTSPGYSRRCLEPDVTTRRALSEGNFPLLADLSTTLDVAWTGDGPPIDAGGQDAPAENCHDFSQVSPQITHDDPGLVEPVQEVPGAGGQLLSDVVQDENNSNIENEGSPSIDLQSSVPTSPIKSDSSEDLTEGSMGAPFANFFKTYSRENSSVSVNSKARAFPPGLSSVISRAAQVLGEGGPRVLLSQGHDDVVVAVYDDEPTTMIAYALSTEEHYVHVTDILVEKEKVKDRDQEKELEKDLKPEQALSHPLQPVEPSVEIEKAAKENLSTSNDSSLPRVEEIENPLISKRASQTVKKTISFSDETPQGVVKFQVTCYFAKQFDALRKKCCVGSRDYIRSLCRCRKWGAQGGKSNVFFAKTADDRFVVKQVTRTELSSFLDFASSYFRYLSEAITGLRPGNETCLAKIFGVYEVKTVKGGKETKMDVLVMENLLYGRRISCLYDLKGSTRSRYNKETGQNQVYLDENLVETILTNPIYIGNEAKQELERAVWNDTNFLSLASVMDYSLLVGVDEERKELVVGIIDFIRQYTWDKHLETWVKASGFLGGPKNTAPTVISPIQYKKRLRKAIRQYFVMIPDQWRPADQLAVPDPWIPSPQLAEYVVDTVQENIDFIVKGEDFSDENDIPRHIPSH